MPEELIALRRENARNHLLIRQKLIDAKEGHLIEVVDEFEHAFDILIKHSNTVTVFGSARLPQGDPACKQAMALGAALAKHDYTVITGGGGGIMQAANHGAKKAGGASIGFNIHLPTEQKLNKYTTDSYRFEHFFSRKVSMTLDASGYVFCAGGFGTYDELFEILTLTQTGNIPRVPIILLGVDFWRPLDGLIKHVMADKFEVIDPDDRELYTITDDIDKAIDLINKQTLDEAREEMRIRADKMRRRWERQREEE